MIHFHLPLIHVVGEPLPRLVCNVDVFVTDSSLNMKHIRHHCAITGPSIRVLVT